MYVSACLQYVYKPLTLSVHAVGDGGAGEWTLGQLHFPRPFTVGETQPLTTSALQLFFAKPEQLNVSTTGQNLDKIFKMYIFKSSFKQNMGPNVTTSLQYLFSLG